MTNKEFYQAVVDGNITDEVTEKAKKLLASATKSTENNDKEKAERKEINLAKAQVIIPHLTNEPQTAMELYKKVQGDTIENLSQVTTALGYAAKEGLVKINDNGKNKANTYQLVENVDETTDEQ